MTQLSIITVTFNNPTDLDLTLNSILSQEFSDFEVIVIDGSPKTLSLPIIAKFSPLFAKKQIEISFYNEPDKGPYDGMNKGIEKARGQWTTFMNSGDEYASPSSLSSLFAHSDFRNEHILAGATQFTMDDGRSYLILPKSMRDSLYRMPFCHQSLFIRTDLLIKNKFDLKYRIVADHAQILGLYLKGYKPFISSTVIAHFKHGGISSDIKKILSETLDLLKNADVGAMSLLKFRIYSFWSSLKMTLKKSVLLKKIVRQMKYKRIN